MTEFTYWIGAVEVLNLQTPNSSHIYDCSGFDSPEDHEPPKVFVAFTERKAEVM